MSWQGFLFRRICRLIPCELQLVGGGRIALSNKYEIASFNDAILHPFYWQLFSQLKSPPKSVVDCGANCGHFTVLSTICSRVLFNCAAEQYTLFEPNPYLTPMIRRTLHNVGILDSSKIVPAFIGAADESVTLWIHPKNYLTSSCTPVPNTIPVKVPVASPCAEIPEGEIDVLKIDIEGGEYDLMRREPELFARCRMLFAEIHETDAQTQCWFYQRLAELGLRESGPKVQHCGQTLAFFTKS